MISRFFKFVGLYYLATLPGAVDDARRMHRRQRETGHYQDETLSLHAAHLLLAAERLFAPLLIPWHLWRVAARAPLTRIDRVRADADARCAELVSRHIREKERE